MNEWFNTNLLSLNFSKTCFMQFQSKNTSTTAINVDYNNKIKSNSTNLKFLGLVIDNTLSWKSHVEMITPKLNQASFMIRITRSVLSLELLKMIYYAYFHSVVAYGLVFWGNSSQSVNILKLQIELLG